MVKRILRSKIFKQFVRFCAVGIVGTAIDFGILNLGVIVFSWNVYLAVTIAFIIAATNNFFINKFWTFSENSKGIKFLGQYMQFLLVSLGGLLLNLGIMYALIEGIDLWYNWAKVVATGVVIMWNFSLNKYWTFRAASVKIKSDELDNRQVGE